MEYRGEVPQLATKPPSSALRRMRGLLLGALLVPALLAGCQRAGGGDRAQGRGEDLSAQILFTANGSYDAQADERGRTSGGVGLRRVEWRTRPPLGARAVTVEYDGDQRPRAWELTAEGAPFGAADVAGEAGVAVQTAQGKGTLVQGGQLAGVLVLAPEPGQLRLLTRGYAVQHDQALLPAFDAPAR